MTSESKGDIDAALQQVIDDVAGRAATLSTQQIRSALASGLTSIGALLPADELDAWSRALADGERLRARDLYR